MKTAKRLLSLVLMLAMIACLGVTAFADNIEAPYFKVVVEDDSNIKYYEATEGESLYDAVEATGLANWTTVNDYYIAGKTHKALVSFDGLGSQGIQNNAVDRAKLSAKGYNYDAITWLGSSHPGYGLISTSTNEEGKTVYNYIYAGYDWTYTSNTTGQIWQYMCCYIVGADEIITLSYNFNVSTWSTTDPIV